MIKVQDKVKEIKHLQDKVLPELKQQLAETKGIFKGRERKALEAQIQQTERKIADKLDKIPDTLKADGYPDVQVFMATYRKTEPLPCGIPYILEILIQFHKKSLLTVYT